MVLRGWLVCSSDLGVDFLVGFLGLVGLVSCVSGFSELLTMW